MFVTKLKFATAVALALGLVGTGFGLYLTGANAQAPAQTGPVPATAVPAVRAPVPEEKKADPKDGEKINLPTGAAPVQVLVSMDKDKKLVVKTAVMNFRMVPVPGGPNPGPGAVPPGPGAAPGQPGGGIGGPPVGAPARVEMVATLRTQTYDLDDVKVLDTKGNKVDTKDLAKMLKEETVAMASLYGQAVDPLHLRVLKEGTLTFILPMPKGINVGPGGPPIGPPGGFPNPQPLPVPPGAFPPGAPGGTGVALPGIALPATPPAPPTEVVPPGKP